MLGEMYKTSQVNDRRAMTVPNFLTIARLGCLPLFTRLVSRPDGNSRRAAAYLLAVMGATDGLDGYIARRFDQVSTVGKVLDPLVDRAVVLGAARGALAAGAVPAWLFGLVAAREGVAAGGAVVLAVAGGPRVEVSRAGKVGALGMMVALPLFVLGRSASRRSTLSRRLAWVAVAAGQCGAWLAVAGYLPAAVSALKDRRQQLSTGHAARVASSL